MTAAWWEGMETEETASASQPKADYELVPEGRHTFTLKAVTEDDGRLELKLVHPDGRYRWVHCSLPHGQKWAGAIAAGLARAVGVSPQDWDDAVASGRLEGAVVAARIYHKVKPTGTYANVGEFHAAEQPSPGPAAKRAAKPASKPAAGASADIPF